MTAYRFCRSDDVPLIVQAYNRCNVGPDAMRWRLTEDAMKRLGREMNLWTSSCMVALAGRDPIGVLIAAKREPTASLILHVGVHPDHRRQGHARHMMTSLSQKMAILEPTLMLAELPADNAVGRGFVEACGFAPRDVLTDWIRPAQMAGDPRELAFAASVPGPEVTASPGFRTIPELDRCWQRSPRSIRNLRERGRGLAFATDRGFEAWLLHRSADDADAPLPFLAAGPAEASGGAPADAPCEVLGFGGGAALPALLRLLLAAASSRTGRPLHLPRVHPAEPLAGRLAEFGFQPGVRTIRWEREAVPG